jgi:glycine hydroxymethyltransferase
MLYLDLENGIGLVDNPHLNRIAAMGIAMEELLRTGNRYAKQTIKNAQTLASSLDALSVPIKFAAKGYTQSHQIFLDISAEKASTYCRRLDQFGIFIDIIGRIGTAEVSHLGMKEPEMEELAHFLAAVFHGKTHKTLSANIKKLAHAYYQKSL